MVNDYLEIASSLNESIFQIFKFCGQMALGISFLNNLFCDIRTIGCHRFNRDIIELYSYSFILLLFLQISNCIHVNFYHKYVYISKL